VTPFIVTSEEEREAALARIALLSRFPPGTPELWERLALIEAVEAFEAFEDARAAEQRDETNQS
jgi:hypothetical protein